MIFFLHTPKTAGTSFYDVVKKNHNYFYTPKWESSTIEELNNHLDKQNTAIRLPGGYETAPKVLSMLAQLKGAKLKQVKFIGGHVGYGFHNHIPIDCTYICYVRDPVERVISDFKEHHKPGRFFYDELKNNHFQLNYYLKLILEANLDNYLTRQLAGPFDFFLKERKAIDNDLFNQSIKNTRTIRFFDMSQFNETLNYFKVNFGWLKLQYKKRNISPKFKSDISFDKELMEMATKFDYMLLKHISLEKLPPPLFWRMLKNKLNW